MSMLVCGIYMGSYHSTPGSGALFSIVGKLHMQIFLAFCTDSRYLSVVSEVILTLIFLRMNNLLYEF